MDERFSIGNVYSPAILDKNQVKLTCDYMEKLRRNDSHALGFIPYSAFEENIRKNRVIIETEGNEPCGFLIWSKMKIRIKILMICIQNDARRIEHATNLLRGVLELKDAWDCLYFQLRCADDLESNKFWKDCGFTHITQVDGGRRKQVIDKPHGNTIDALVDSLIGDEALANFQKAKITYRKINVYRQWLRKSKTFSLQPIEDRLRFFSVAAG